MLMLGCAARLRSARALWREWKDEITRRIVHGEHDPAAIRNWKQFIREVKPKGCRLLKNIEQYPGSVLVTGCQRSGTTMLSRIITRSDGMVDYKYGRDDELDAALILSGCVEHNEPGRYCFQTTYLNECYREYWEHTSDFKIVWVLRNPMSVVYSLTYNWRGYALNDLFNTCGVRVLDDADKKRYERYGRFAMSSLRRACFAYNGKISQLFELVPKLEYDRIMIVDYDNLVSDADEILASIYKFIGLPYKPAYADSMQTSSLSKADKLNKREKAEIEMLCNPVYEKARDLMAE